MKLTHGLFLFPILAVMMFSCADKASSSRANTYNSAEAQADAKSPSETGDNAAAFDEELTTNASDALLSPSELEAKKNCNQFQKTCFKYDGTIIKGGNKTLECHFYFRKGKKYCHKQNACQNGVTRQDFERCS